MPFNKSDVDSQRAIRKLQRAETLLQAGTGDAVKQIGELLKNSARLAAPRDTGRTMRNIVKRRETRNSVRVVAQNSTPNKRYQGRTFNLPRWMHSSPRARIHIKTGYPNFMDRAESRVRPQVDDITEKSLTERLARLD